MEHTQQGKERIDRKMDGGRNVGKARTEIAIMLQHSVSHIVVLRTMCSIEVTKGEGILMM